MRRPKKKKVEKNFQKNYILILKKHIKYAKGKYIKGKYINGKHVNSEGAISKLYRFYKII